ncbi:MAG: hypothetical protein SXG53_13420 [Pseudomonadota bacterium]|nr:hypothetical protein [Pseudomonadota bacterium]
MQRTIRWFSGWIAGLTAAVLAVGVMSPVLGQTQPTYQIVWVVIGEASSASEQDPAHAGRQLFMASELMAKNLAKVKIEQVEVVPVVREITVGDRLCVTQMSIRTLGPGREPIGDAPLSISVRQDHKQRLGLSRSKRNICLRPNAAGEYPVRLTSLLPARDGTMRGAQVYIRVKESTETDHSRAAGLP